LDVGLILPANSEFVTPLGKKMMQTRDFLADMDGIRFGNA